MAIETAEERQVLVDLGARIRARRQARGLTLAALALRCGLPAAALSQIETGKRDLPGVQSVSHRRGAWSDHGDIAGGGCAPRNGARSRRGL